jgi:hypothetical protein
MTAEIYVMKTDSLNLESKGKRSHEETTPLDRIAWMDYHGFMHSGSRGVEAMGIRWTFDGHIRE